MDGDLVYCNNIQELTEELQFEHASQQWRLFIYISRASLKALLVHNGNKFPSIPMAHAVHMTETYENLQGLLQKIRHEEHRRDIFLDINLQQYLLGCKADTLNPAVFFYVSATAERGIATTYRHNRSVECGTSCNRGSVEKLYTSTAY